MTEPLVLELRSDVVGWPMFNEEEKRLAVELAKQIDVKDSQTLLTYGFGVQQDISDFSNTILSEVQSRDSGYVGEILSDLLLKVKEVNVDSLGSGGGFLARIPLLAGLVGKFKLFMARYEKLSVQIERLVKDLGKAGGNLLHDIAMMDNLYDKNQVLSKTLDICIAAGQMKLRSLQEQVLPNLKLKSDVKEYNDLIEFMNRFDNTLQDMQSNRKLVAQLSPQIHVIRDSSRELEKKIQHFILETIPLWKNRIVDIISLFRQKKAQQLQEELSGPANDSLDKSGTGFGGGSGQDFVDIQSLKEVNTDMIAAIEDILNLREKDREKRMQAEKELVKIARDLKVASVRLLEEK